VKLKFKKRFFALAVAFSTLLASNIYAQTVNMTLVYDGVSHKYSAQEVKIKIDGQSVENLDVPPIIINDRTMVPARAVFEKMGAEVAWNDETREVYITKDSTLVVLKIDSSTGSTNGTEFKMDTPAKIVNDRTMIPVRAASEALGCIVGWDDSTRVVTINSAGYVEPSGNTNPPAVTSSVSVTGVTVPSSTAATQTFTIRASGEIQKFEHFILEEDRLVVDIYNADNNVSNSNITVTNSSIVKAVRSGQNQTEPEKIARVVLDLAINSKYSAVLSSDKKSIVINFEAMEITDLDVKRSGNNDIITVYGKTTPAVNVFTLSNPDRLVIDIPNSKSYLDDKYSSNLNYIDNIRVGEPEKGTTRIVLDLNKYISFKVSEGLGYVTVEVSKSTLDNLIYNHSNRTLVLQNTSGLSVSDFSITDDYRNKKYILTLPGNYQSAYGYGTIPVGDEYIKSISIANSGNRTQIIVDENTIIATKISADSGEIRIQFVNPKEIYDKVIVIDAGHGGTDPGTSGNGLVEKEIALDIMLRVYDLLEKDSRVKVYATRVDDSYPTNVSRAVMGNLSADLFVSIHFNSVASAGPNGTEVLYMERATDSSGKLTSKIAAQMMQNYLISALGTTDRGIKSRPDLIVLNQSTIPAILVEIAFLSNEEDAKMITKEENRKLAAEAIYSAIIDMTNQYKIR